MKPRKILTPEQIKLKRIKDGETQRTKPAPEVEIERAPLPDKWPKTVKCMDGVVRVFGSVAEWRASVKQRQQGSSRAEWIQSEDFTETLANAFTIAVEDVVEQHLAEGRQVVGIVDGCLTVIHPPEQVFLLNQLPADPETAKKAAEIASEVVKKSKQ